VSVDVEIPFGTGAVEPMQEDRINSKMISRAACLAELTSNPKSFFNCPDLHGGPGLPEGARSSEPGAESKEQGVGRWERSKTLKAETLTA
jgi:hypothetical protein